MTEVELRCWKKEMKKFIKPEEKAMEGSHLMSKILSWPNTLDAPHGVAAFWG